METISEASEGALQAVGVSPADEDIYRALLERPGSAAANLAASTGVTTKHVRSALGRLERLGLVSRVVGTRDRFVPAPPIPSIEVLILSSQEQLERTRLAAADLDAAFRAAAPHKPIGPMDVVEVVLGREAVDRRFEQLINDADEQVLAFVKPPFALEAAEPSALELKSLKRGVSHRAIYTSEALSIRGMLDRHIRVVGEAGEEARSLPDLPMKLFVTDRRSAFIPLSLDTPGMEGALLIQPSPVLEALVSLFELHWGRAIPIGMLDESGAASTSSSPTSAHDSELVALLVAGLKDNAIARQLGVAPRTVLRRVAALMNELGAQTRFQAGWLSARRRPDQ